MHNYLSVKYGLSGVRLFGFMYKVISGLDDALNIAVAII